MSHYEQRLSQDTEYLMGQVSRLAQFVDRGLRDSVKALESGDTDLAYRTVLRDGPINRLTEEIESDAHRFMAKHLPSGGHLRFVSSTMRIAILLERMGDYAVTISRHAATLKVPLEGAFQREVSAMAADAIQMFGQAMQAFRQKDASMALGTMGYSEQVDRDYVNALTTLEEEDPNQIPIEDLFARLVIIRQLERVSDQAKNLCEETVFALTGETKNRKPVPVLVVNGADDGASHIVALIAERLYGDKLVVETAGVTPAESIRDDVKAFLSERGFDTSSRRPRSLDNLPKPLSSYKVVVSLETPVLERMGSLPYASVGLTWRTEKKDDLDAVYRDLASELGELVKLVRG
ncbi:MAG: hypothetical protein JJ896_18360 [Rhodothermales bacterium]|nr:hypothetical protein [Rhodothermales bacterium]MBO6781628.1 hypothetical protein [Rhodothermales bacterium]